MKLKKYLVTLVAMSSLATVIVPSAISVYAQEVHQDKAVEPLFEGFSEVEVQRAIDDFQRFLGLRDISEEDLDAMTSLEKDELIDDYINSLSRRRLAVTKVLAVIASAITIARGVYNGGRYAARQLNARGLLTRAQYRNLRGVYFAAILKAFGILAATGFDNYMMGR